ncbi:MAG: SDR family NAD(P)-dependent oxidoreductase [Stappiaceae bacterium]
MTRRFEGKVALVTGASRGIGYALAEALGNEGAHVIAVARTVGGLEELDDSITGSGGSATLVPLNITDSPGIDRLGAAIYERWGKLDIVVGNAGVLGQLSPMGHIEPKSWDEVMAVNVTANWRLIRSTDPLLRAADAGRALFLSSSAAHSCKPYWGAYSASKAALEALVRTYAAEMQNKSSVCVNLANPGPARTAMRAKAMPGENPETLVKPAEIVAELLPLLEPSFTETGKLYDFPTRNIISLEKAA